MDREKQTATEIDTWQKKLQTVDSTFQSYLSKQYFLGDREMKQKLTDEAARELAAVLVPAESVPEKELNQSTANQHLEALLDKPEPKNVSQHIKYLDTWVKQDPSRLKDIENAIATKLRQGQAFDINMLSLLAETNEHRQELFVENDLARALELEKNCRFPIPVFNQLHVMNQLNDPRSNLQLHKIIDFAQNHLVTVQSRVEREIQAEFPGRFENGLAFNFHRFAGVEKDCAKNYLVQKHLIDHMEALNIVRPEKEGAIYFMVGGTSDGTIFSFDHVKETYQHNLALGLFAGYPIINPVVGIAPGKLGYYHNGQLEKIFVDKPDPEKAAALQKKLVDQNKPGDEKLGISKQSIYDLLQQDIPTDPEYLELSQQKFSPEGYWQDRALIKHQQALAKADRQFFYDTTKLPIDKLPRLVLANIFTNNQEIIRKEEGTKNQSQSLEQEKYLKEVFPLGKIAENQAYDYRYLQSLQM
ncbi:hypothetical protein ACFL2B_03135, partial [Patescibacteria group bacterium]